LHRRETVWRFQSTSPARGRDEFQPHAPKFRDISIHEPRAGARPDKQDETLILLLISIHEPRAGARRGRLCAVLINERFQSTSPARGRDVTVLHCVD